MITNGKWFSLVKLMIATAIIGISAAIPGAFAQTTTASANDMLKRCIFSKEPGETGYDAKDPYKCTTDDKCDCVPPTDPTKPIPLRLYQGGTSASAELTGFYDDKGARCADQSGAAENCIFRITASVTPVCPASATSCKKAQTFIINYEVSNVKQMPGMMPFATVRTSTDTDRPPITVPYSAIRAAKYTTVDCKVLYADNINMQYQSGVDSMGQPICGRDPNQDTIDKVPVLEAELCRAQINAAWNNSISIWSSGATQSGSATTIACEKIYVEKVFKLSNSSKTTDDCTKAGGLIYKNGNNVTPTEIGGTVTTSNSVLLNDTQRSAFIAKYGLAAVNVGGVLQPAADGTFECMEYIPVPVAEKNVSATENWPVPASLVPDTLTFILVGGGGGGSASDYPNWPGQGGLAGQRKTQVFNPAAGTECKITVGAGGGGGDTEPLDKCGSPNNGKGGGDSGEASSVTCGGVTAQADGGSGSACTHTGAGTTASAGGNSPVTNSGGGASGDSTSDGAGGAGTKAGAGGGGASVLVTDGDHTGGPGASGYVHVTYSVYSLKHKTL